MASDEISGDFLITCENDMMHHIFPPVWHGRMHSDGRRNFDQTHQVGAAALLTECRYFGMDEPFTSSRSELHDIFVHEGDDPSARGVHASVAISRGRR